MELFSTQQVAKRLNIGRSTVNKFALAHDIGQKLGVERVFTQADVEALDEALKAAPKKGRPRRQKAKAEAN